MPREYDAAETPYIVCPYVLCKKQVFAEILRRIFVVSSNLN